MPPGKLQLKVEPVAGLLLVNVMHWPVHRLVAEALKAGAGGGGMELVAPGVSAPTATAEIPGTPSQARPHPLPLVPEPVVNRLVLLVKADALGTFTVMLPQVPLFEDVNENGKAPAAGPHQRPSII